MTRKQIVILSGAAPAMLTALLVCFNAQHLEPTSVLPADDTADRLAFAARWLILPGLTLLAGIQGAGRRWMYPDTIDGTRTPANPGFEINLRYNQNTLEQVVLAAIAWTGLALSLPHDRLTIIPAMAGLFTLGRITFWICYLIYPTGRAFGMVLTAAPTVGAYVWLVWRLVLPK